MHRLSHAVLSAAFFTVAAAHGEQLSPVQWEGPSGNGHWYSKVVWDTPKSWAQSRAQAEQWGGSLACVTSEPERLFIKALGLAQAPCGSGSQGWLLGGYQDLTAPDYQEPGGGWRWVSGEPWSYAVWFPGRPDDYGQGGQNFLNLPPEPFDAVFDDVEPGNDSATSCGAIIEWSADCNNDGIVDFGQCRDGSLPDFNGNHIPDCCERNEQCVVDGSIVQWRFEAGGNGHWYQLVRNPEGIRHWPFESARQEAIARNAHLAMFTSVSESASLHALLRTPQTVGAAAVWVGLYQDRMAPDYAEPAGGWRWLDGRPLSFNPWLPNEPSNACGWQPNAPQDWGAWVSGSAGGRLDDFGNPFPNCPDIVWVAVFEWSDDCNNDGIVDFGQVADGSLSDFNNNGVPEVCECAGADINHDGAVAGADLAALLSSWGPSAPGAPADLDRSGAVDGLDLAIMLAFWGPCS